MSHVVNGLDTEHIDLLKKAMDSVSDPIKDILETVTGQSVDRHAVQNTITPAEDVTSLMDLGAGPLATLSCMIHGDLEGTFLYLQTKEDYLTLAEVMSPALSSHTLHTVNQATDYLIPDWLLEQRKQNTPTAGIETKVADKVTELGTGFLTACLQALYGHCKLSTFQDMPEALFIDDEQSALKAAVPEEQDEPGIALALGIEYTIAQKNLGAWLLLLPQAGNLRAALDRLQST